MFSLVALAVLVCAASAQVQYPAGVSPAACPNYPHCDTLAYISPAGVPRTREYPSGLAAAACPNFPYCNQAVLPRYTGQYPAGVSAASCPNYPNC